MSQLKVMSFSIFVYCVLLIDYSFLIEHRAIYPYSAQQEGDLTLEPDDVVVVLEMLDNDWWRGCKGQQEGWFPGTYVEVCCLYIYCLYILLVLVGNTDTRNHFYVDRTISHLIFH